MPHVPSRAGDEQLLRWLRARSAGMGWADNARINGGTRGNVQNMCKAVRDADVAHCGPGVAWAYEQGAWRGKA